MTKARRRGRYIVAPGILLTIFLVVRGPSVFALDPSLDISQYAHTSWKIRDGFPKGNIRAFAQTPDGYLWLGTEFGLVRFDGVRGVPWQPPTDHQSLPSEPIISLLTARDGALWIGTDKGLASWKDGKLTQYPELAGHYVFSLLEDSEGTMWAGGLAVPTGRLCEIRNGRAQCVDAKGFGLGVYALFEDSRGNLWAGVNDGVWRWKPRAPEFYPLPEAGSIRSFAESDGTLLIGTRDGIRRLVNEKFEAYPLWGAIPKLTLPRFLRDRDGGLWIGSAERGLVHMHNGRADVFGQSLGLSGDLVVALFEDQEGSIWVATDKGLDRFRGFAVSSLSENQGLSSNAFLSILTASDGSIWINGATNMNRLSQGQITIFREDAQNRSAGLPNVHEIIGSGLPDRGLGSLFQDARGQIWVATQKGGGYLKSDRFVSVPGIPGGVVRSIVEDSQSNLWINHQQLGLLQVVNATEAKSIPWAELGHTDFATALVADRAKGGLWLGFWDGGVAYFADGQVRASYSIADGLGQGHVRSFQIDPDGAVWAATQGGLSRLKDGAIATLTSNNGLPCNSVNWMIEDDAHSFWLYTSCGLVRVSKSELDAWAVDTERTIRVTVFDTSDGVKGMAETSGFTPQVGKAPDGKLWFTAGDVVCVVDPMHLPFNKLPPPVHVEQITADRKAYDVTSEANGQLRLPPLIRDLEINFTALSLVAPEKILFRYKLEDHDRDWQEAGNRRQAFYNDLPPGNYRFLVTACNNNGVWNEAGTYLDFTIAPAYYQTTWFRAAGVLALLLALVALYQLRVRQVASQVRAGIEGRLDERERIARDLHDTLLQSVQGLILKFHAVSRQIPPDAAARDALEKTLDHADRVLAEGRDRVRNLRASADSIDDLPAAFKRIAQETPGHRAITFKTVVEGSVRELNPLVQEESYCIGREAIVNALTHSGCRQIEVEITYELRQFRLRVRDDGHGVDHSIIEQGGRPDHWGMHGMRERANKIGAQLKLWSGRETGTEVELIVPGVTAYQSVDGRSTRSLLRRLLG